jgi:hypothetical protein
MSYEKVFGAWLYGLVQGLQRQTGDHPPVSYSKYLQAAFQKGGCEGWVQVELAILFESMPYFSHVEREQPVYTDTRKACDFLVTFDKKDGSPIGQCIVEVKCETLFHSSDLGRVTMDHKQYQEVAADVNKLKYERSPAYASTPALVMVVAFSGEAIRGLDNYFAPALLDNSERKQIFDAEHFGERYSLAIYSIAV